MNELRVTFAGQTYSFSPGQTVRIGRHPDNAVVVSDPIVSRDHAKLTFESGSWLLDDLGKGRTFVGGLPVGSVQVHQPLEVHLAGPLGPELRIEVVGADDNAAVPVVQAMPRNDTRVLGAVQVAPPPPAPAPEVAAPPTPRLGWLTAGHPVSWAEKDGLIHLGPAPAVVTPRPEPSESWPQAARLSRTEPDSPGGDFATAVHILVPIRSWLKDPGWKQGSRLLVIAYGLLPSLFVVFFSTTTSTAAPGWAYSLSIAPLWAVAFWLLIRPGRITRLIACLAIAIIAAVNALLPILTVPWEDALHSPASQHNLLAWIYGVGFAEEVTKALPILIAALALRWIWRITLDVRIWMFLGTIAGLTFGVIESVRYTKLVFATSGHDTIALILTFALRVFVDGFQHAVWAGIAAFFIGMGVNYRRRRIPLIVFGITLPAVLHGLNDWATLLASLWLWIAVEGLSMLLFIGYTMSAATIERQVRDTPLFRGESMIMQRPWFGHERPG